MSTVLNILFSSKKIMLSLFRRQAFRTFLVKTSEQYLKKALFNDTKVPVKASNDLFIIISNLFKTINRQIELGRISYTYISKLIKPLALAVQPDEGCVNRFENKYYFKPPLFLHLRPTRAFNPVHTLNASGDTENATSMDYATVTRILDEKRDSWGSYFTVISGDEPFKYQDGERTIFDVFERYPESLFLVYTNGKLITETMANRIAELGNVVLAISFEGFEDEANARYVPYAETKIFNAFEHLRNAGVLFGVSLLVSDKNVDFLLNINNLRLLCDYFYDIEGASFALLFQHKPVGGSYNTINFKTQPNKHKQLIDVMWKIVYEGKYFLADIENIGTLSAGCHASGLPFGGYIHIDWKGNVMPCISNPCCMDNMHETYSNNGHLDDVLQSPLMKVVRKWQVETYYYDMIAYCKSSREQFYQTTNIQNHDN